jgi:hypothetical protein
MNCPSCSHSNLEGAVRCEMCGHDLEGDGEAGEGSWATMAMPVPKELLEAATLAAAEVHADMAESEARAEAGDGGTESEAGAETGDGGMGATMGMQAVPAELLRLAIDPATGEFTGGLEAKSPATGGDEIGEAPDDVEVGMERTVFEQLAIGELPDVESDSPEAQEPQEAVQEPQEASDPVSQDDMSTAQIETSERSSKSDAPVARSPLRTVVWVAVGLGVLAMLVPLIMSMPSGGGPAAGKMIDNFPSHTNVIGNLSLSRFRTTWVFNEYGEKALVSALDRVASDGFKKSFGVDLNQVDMIAAGVQLGDGGAAETLIALQGRFASDSVETALKESRGDLEPGAPGPVADGAFFGKLADSTGMVDEHTILQGSAGMIAAALAARGGSASVGTHVGLASALKQVDGEALLWGGVQNTKDLLKSVRESLPSELAGLLAEGDAAAFSVEIGEGIVVRVSYFAVDEGRAVEMGEKLQSRMDQVKLLAKSGAPNLAEAIDAVETSHAGSVVTMKANLSREVAERVLKSLNVGR